MRQATTESQAGTPAPRAGLTNHRLETCAIQGGVINPVQCQGYQARISPFQCIVNQLFREDSFYYPCPRCEQPVTLALAAPGTREREADPGAVITVEQGLGVRGQGSEKTERPPLMENMEKEDHEDCRRPPPIEKTERKKPIWDRKTMTRSVARDLGLI